MFSSARHIFLPFCALALFVSALAGCSPQAAGVGDAGQASDRGYALTRCTGQQAVPTRTGTPPASQPAVYAGSVGGKLYAFSPDTGAVRWCNRIMVTGTFPCPRSCPPPPVAVIGTPLGAQGVVFVCVSGYGGYTYAFNARDGSLRWLRKTDCEVVSIPFVDYALPIEADGVLYTGAYALDAQDGKMLWRLPMEESFGAVVNGVIYAYSQGAVYAFDAKDRSLRWSYTLDDTIGNVPTVADGSVYVGDINGNGPSGMTPGLPDTYALDAATGALRWRYESGMVGGSAVVANGVVYISGFPCALYALDAARGKLRWRYQADTCSSSTPIVINGVVYFTADGAYAFDASDGTVRWHTGLGANQGNRFTSPTVMNGALYLGKIDGSGYSTLYALDASTGAELWHEEGINQLSPSQAGD